MTTERQAKLAEALNHYQHILEVDLFGGDEGCEAFIRARSMFGRISSMVLEITEAQLYAWAVDRVVIQKAMPNLSPEEREFLQTGTHPSEWDALTSETEEV